MGRWFLSQLQYLSLVPRTWVLTSSSPLFQQASTTRFSTPTRNVTLHARVVPEIPSYKTGYTNFNPDSSYVAIPYNLHPVIDDYTAGRPIQGAIEGCLGKCLTSVQGI